MNNNDIKKAISNWRTGDCKVLAALKATKREEDFNNDELRINDGKNLAKN